MEACWNATTIPLDKSIFLSVSLTKILCGVSVSETRACLKQCTGFNLTSKLQGSAIGKQKSYAVQNFAFKCNDEVSLLPKTCSFKCMIFGHKSPSTNRNARRRRDVKI